MMRIHAPTHSVENGMARLSYDIESQGETRPLWFSVPQTYGDHLSRTAEPAVLGLLTEAMARGEDIAADASISARLQYNLPLVADLVARAIPGLRPVAVTAAAIDDAKRARAPGVATGFSGGVDSFCTVCDHFDAAIPKEFRISHFLFNNVGSHGALYDEATRVFKERYDLLKEFPEAMGIPFVPIDSNLQTFCKLQFQQTHTLRNVAAVATLPGLFGRYYYSSAARYEDSFVGPSRFMGYMDPFLLPMLSTESLDCISAGGQYSRVQKTMRIADYGPAHKFLNVCVKPGRVENCSKCWKCCRTILTLELIGKEHLFGDVFDLAKFRAARSTYLRKIHKNRHDVLNAEVIALGKSVGKDLRPGLPYRVGRYGWDAVVKTGRVFARSRPA